MKDPLADEGRVLGSMQIKLRHSYLAAQWCLDQAGRPNMEFQQDNNLSCLYKERHIENKTQPGPEGIISVQGGRLKTIPTVETTIVSQGSCFGAS